jgi:hypothetical protein
MEDKALRHKRWIGKRHYTTIQMQAEASAIDDSNMITMTTSLANGQLMISVFDAVELNSTVVWCFFFIYSNPTLIFVSRSNDEEIYEVQDSQTC